MEVPTAMYSVLCTLYIHPEPRLKCDGKIVPECHDRYLLGIEKPLMNYV